MNLLPGIGKTNSGAYSEGTRLIVLGETDIAALLYEVIHVERRGGISGVTYN